MPRPQNPFPKVKMHIALEQSLYAQLVLILPADPANPLSFAKGQLSAFIARAVLAEIARVQAAREAS